MSATATLPTGDSRASRVAYRICRSLVCWFTMAFTRMRIEGREHLDGIIVIKRCGEFITGRMK